MGSRQAQVSRRKTESNVSSGTSPLTAFPFTFNVIFVICLSLVLTSHEAFSRPKPDKRPISREVSMISQQFTAVSPQTHDQVTNLTAGWITGVF